MARQLPLPLKDRVAEMDFGYPTPCLTWLGAPMKSGYGALSVNGQTWRAHVYAYTEMIGPVPKGLELDHLCRNKLCVNPDHLEPITHQENCRRGDNYQRRQTHCKNGHEFTKENTYLKPDGKRACRACNNLAWRRSRDRRLNRGMGPRCAQGGRD